MEEKERDNRDFEEKKEGPPDSRGRIIPDAQAAAIIFGILGIDVTCDKKEIKRAYTAKARTVSPEEDPEGFARLHDAYRNALVYAEIKSDPSARFIPKGLVEELPSSEDTTAPSADVPSSDALPDYDFSAVDMSGAPPKTKAEFIISDIVLFKRENGLDTKQAADKIPSGTRMKLTAMLLTMYRALALETDDETVWESFTEEAVVKAYLRDYRFRDFLRSAMPKETKHEERVNDLMDMYDNFYGRPSGDIPAQPFVPAGPSPQQIFSDKADELPPPREETYLPPAPKPEKKTSRIVIIAILALLLIGLVAGIGIIYAVNRTVFPVTPAPGSAQDTIRLIGYLAFFVIFGIIAFIVLSKIKR